METFSNKIFHVQLSKNCQKKPNLLIRMPKFSANSKKGLRSGQYLLFVLREGKVLVIVCKLCESFVGSENREQRNCEPHQESLTLA